jgi:molybdopterin converting factor small subunit
MTGPCAICYISGVRILFFAHLKDVTRCAETELDCDDVDAGGLWEKLIGKHPGLARFRGSVRLAKNWEYAGPDARFGRADEVALIPPVSGG